jgi:hypothetical protein
MKRRRSIVKTVAISAVLAAALIDTGTPSEKRLDVRRHPRAAAMTKRRLMERA